MERHDAALSSCTPPLTGWGTSHLAVFDEVAGPVSDADDHWILLLFVLDEADVPSGSWFLDGIPVRFLVSGPVVPL
jgi:hypothetical protein